MKNTNNAFLKPLHVADQMRIILFIRFGVGKPLPVLEFLPETFLFGKLIGKAYFVFDSASHYYVYSLFLHSSTLATTNVSSLEKSDRVSGDSRIKSCRWFGSIEDL